jgi:hypothetical protein
MRGRLLFREVAGFSLLLFLPSVALCQQIVDEPYIALLELNDTDHPRNELKSLRSDIQEQRSKLIDACKREEARLKEQRDAARRQLRDLNDTRATAETRAGLHRIVDASEEPLRKTRMECEPAISAAFEVKRTKLRVAKDWPGRRDEILRAIDAGRARKRKLGDIEDIGYRKFFDGQEKDVSTGEQAMRQMKFSGMMPPELQNAAVQDYVRRLAGKIARNSDLKVPLHVTVVDSPEITAIALPGGFLFISSGLIQAAGTESELAGVLGHEIARIAARHGTRASKRSRVSGIFMQAARVASGLLTGGFSSAPALYGINYGFQGLDAIVDRTLMAAQEKYETEADQLGVQYAWKAGFDPRGFVMLFDSISQQEYSRTASFFRTHPHLDERMLDVFSEIQFLPEGPTPTRDSVEFHQIKERIQK